MKLLERLQERAIERLIELHKINCGRVDFAVFDAKHAIYYLQGGAITTAINARKLVGEIGMLGREWRFAVELSRTIDYFDELETNSRQLKAWFQKNALPERRTGSKADSSSRQEKSGLSEKFFTVFDDQNEKLVNELSIFAHPKFPAVRYNITEVTHTFDYYQTRVAHKSDLLRYHAIFVSEAISCFLTPTRSLPLTAEYFTELFEIKKQLNSYLAEEEPIAQK